MSFYDELCEKTEPARAEFRAIPALIRGQQGQISQETYLAFLTQAYHHVKHTVPLLMACGAALPERLEWLRRAVAKYIEEETGHEDWILNDIRACGGDAEAVRGGAPSPATELMVAYAYDTIHRNNPAGFFGMVLVLEGTSIALAHEAARSIQTALGLPDESFTYLQSHGTLDQSHMEFFRSLVDRLDRDEDRQAVLHGAVMFYRLYGDIFRGLPLD